VVEDAEKGIIAARAAVLGSRWRRAASARAALGELQFAAFWDEGRAMTPEQAVNYALTTGSD
jgi:hypothetical protein